MGWILSTGPLPNLRHIIDSTQVDGHAGQLMGVRICFLAERLVALEAGSVKIWYQCSKEGSVEETKGAKVKPERSGVRLESGSELRKEPLLYTRETRRSEGGTVASTYGLCHHMYTCPNLTLLVLCFPRQGRTKSKGKSPRVHWSLPEFCGTWWNC